MNKTKRKGRVVSFSLTSPTPSLIPSSPCPVLLRPPSAPENPNPVEPSTGDLSHMKQRGGREQRRRWAAGHESNPERTRNQPRHQADAKGSGEMTSDDGGGDDD